MLPLIHPSGQASSVLYPDSLLAMLPPEDSPSQVTVIAWLVLALAAIFTLIVFCRGPRTPHWLRNVTVGAAACCYAGFCILSLMPPVAQVRDADPRAITQQRMKQLALALVSYADRHEGRLPAAAVWSADGRPLLSWRVLLLPLLEQEALYRQFHLDEPWNSPHNLTLLSHMPKVYAPPPGLDLNNEPFTTFYQVFMGKGTAFEEKTGVRYPEDFIDGTSRTILIAEAGKAVPWTKPEDLVYEADQPLPPLGGIFAGERTRTCGWHVALGDGSARLISPGMSETTIRDAITRNDGRKLGPDW